MVFTGLEVSRELENALEINKFPSSILLSVHFFPGANAPLD